MASSVAEEVKAIRAALERLERTQGGRFERPAVSFAVAAAMLRVSASQLSAMITTGELRAVFIERRRWVPVSEVERLHRR